MSENLKKLTGKNPKDFEPVAYSLINTPDSGLFKELVEKDDYLYDFIKQNVSNRLEKVCNKDNYTNLIQLLKYYSPSYEDFIVNTLSKYADEDLTDTMLEKFENGTDDEKTYAAKYFAFIKDPLAKDFLINNAYSDNEYLAQNCASTLASWEDRESFTQAIKKLKDNDDFEKIKAVKFLTAYGDKSAVTEIINAMKTSAMSENIAGEIPYLINLFELTEKYYVDALLVINNIINGLGEILPLSIVFDFELYDVFEMLMNKLDSKCAVVLLNAIEKFETLTENDEYLFDEDKDTKNEINDIKNNLNKIDKNKLKKGIIYELPSGIIFNNAILNNIFPKIPIKISPTGSVMCKLLTDIKNYGINKKINIKNK